MVRLLEYGERDTLMYPPGVYNVAYRYSTSSYRYWTHVEIDKYHTELEILVSMQKWAKNIYQIQAIEGDNEPLLYSEYKAMLLKQEKEKASKKEKRIFK